MRQVVADVDLTAECVQDVESASLGDLGDLEHFVPAALKSGRRPISLELKAATADARRNPPEEGNAQRFLGHQARVVCRPVSAPASLDAFVAESPIQRKAIANFVRDFADSLSPGARVLDAGSGTAPYRGLFSRSNYRTQDWTWSVHGGGQGADIIGDLDAGLAVDSCSFDAVLCTEVLEHVADPQRVLAELYRLLVPGGRIAISVPFVGPLHEEPHDHRRPTNHGLAAVLANAEFVDVDVRPLTGWFSTFAHVLRDQALSTQAPDVRPTLLQRAVGFAFYILSEGVRRVAPLLDRHLDRRRALPLGWTATATRGSS